MTRLVLRSLRSVDASLPTLVDPVRLAASFPQALALLAAVRPSAIFTTGGYVALPVAVAAWLLRVPLVLWEGNVVPGRSVRTIARLARVRAVSFGETCRRLPAPCVRHRDAYPGSPVR